MEETRVIICSDVHLCHIDWYGLSSAERMEKLISDLNSFYEERPYEKVVFLGDYSLDFWGWDIGGSYVREGISNTENFVKQYASRLKVPCHFHPGNHEQYGYDKWLDITGDNRDDSFVVGGYLFIMSDNFSGVLDPDFHTDGEYTPTKLDFVRERMKRYPDLPVILCSHFFDFKKEPDEFFDFIKNEKRITALFCGHDHLCAVTDLDRRADDVCLYHDGHYSYAGGGKSPLELMWGFCEVKLCENGVYVRYIEPESRFEYDGKSHIYGASEKKYTFFKRRDI